MASNDEFGATPSERYLGRLCKASFLSLWSYQNVYTDRGKTKSNRSGKELCDLLVVFGNHIIIFSDKSCQVPNTGDVMLDWSRWYKRAIKRSAEQIFGAERWLAEFPERIYLDRLCSKPFPLDIPNPKNWIVHRIVVALGAGSRAAEYFGGGSRGSLMLVPEIAGDQHLTDDLPAGLFRIGEVDPEKGFVHVFDDVNLDIVMREVDTIGDFVRYLSHKEDFFRSGRLLCCCGEEDLLAYYLLNLDEINDPFFQLQDEISEKLRKKYFTVCIDDNWWDEYENSRSFDINR